MPNLRAISVKKMSKLKLLIFVAMFVVSFSSAFGNRNRLSIGAFFDGENSDVELAFKYAIQWHNIYDNEGTNFDAHTQLVPLNNLFHTRALACNITSIDSGVIAIFGPQNPIAHLIIHHVCKNHHIPYIQTTWQPPTYDPPLISLNFFPAANLLTEGFAKILHYLQWENYAIVYQNDDALIRLQGIFEVLEKTDKSIPVKQLKPSKDYRPIFKKLKTSGITNVILDCETDDTLKILEQAAEVGLLTHSSTYLLTSLDAHTLDYELLNTRANIFFVRLFDPSNRYLDYNIQMWSLSEAKNDRRVFTTPKTIRTTAVLMIDAIDLVLNSVNDMSREEMLEAKPMFCDYSNTWYDGREFANHLKKYPLNDPITGPIAFDKYGRRVNFTLQLVKMGRSKVEFSWSPDEEGI